MSTHLREAWRRRIEGAVNSLDQLPPKPGTQPVPGGKVRCWTIVGALGQSFDPRSVLRDGLRVDRATTYRDQFGEFRAVWATVGAPTMRDLRGRPLVIEFAVPAEEASTTTTGHATPGGTVTFGRDIAPSEFIAVYTPWMVAAWDLIDGGERYDPNDPENEWMFEHSPDTSTYPEDDWQKAVAYWKKSRR